MDALEFLLQSGVVGAFGIGGWQWVKFLLKERDDRINALQADYDTKIDDLHNELKAERKARKSITDQFGQLNLDFQALERERDENKDALEASEARFTKAWDKLLEREQDNISYRKKITEQNETILRQNDRIAALVNDLNRAEMENDATRKQLIDTQSKRDALASDKILLLAEIKELASERDTLITEKNETLKAVKGINDTIGKRFDDLEQSVKDAINKIAERIDILEQKVAELEAKEGDA